MEQQFAQAREQELARTARWIAGIFSHAASQTVAFRFDGFAFWGKSGGGAEDLWRYLREQDLWMDPWKRAVWDLTEEQAQAIARLVEEWNHDWEYAIASRYPVEVNDYYNAYPLSFSQASGTEQEIETRSPNGLSGTAWRWS